jgi:hypothetical protein
VTVVVRYGRTEGYLSLPGVVGARPFIPVRLQHGGRHLDTFGLIDSGADTALFNLQFAQALGFTVDPTKVKTTRGVGGTVDVWNFDLHILAFGKRLPARIGFSANWTSAFGLLGREDFFVAFQVGFDQPNRNVLLHSAP